MGCISDTIADVQIKRCFSCKEEMAPNETQKTQEGDPVCDYCWSDYLAECWQDKGVDSNA